MTARPEPSPGPLRTCVGCRSVRSQRDLVRIVRRPDGILVVGRTLPGRGAWLCRGHPECLERAARSGGFNRAFRTTVRPEQLTGLRRELDPGRSPV